MIEIADLTYRNLSIRKLAIGSGRTFLIGKNGSGKTTLLRILAGIDIPASGSVTIDGLSPRETDAGWVNEYPDRSLLFSRVSDEIASSLRFAFASCSDTKSRVTDVAEMTGIPYLLERQVGELSGGEKVLVAVAAALVRRPPLLVLDEYDSHLDSPRCRQIENAIRSAAPRYVIRCTQQMEAAAKGDAVIALEGGRVAFAGTPAEVFGHLAHTPFYPRSWRGRQ